LIEEIFDETSPGALRDANIHLTGVLEENAAVLLASVIPDDRDHENDWFHSGDGLLSEGIAEMYTIWTQKVIMNENVSLSDKLYVSWKFSIRICIYNKELQRNEFDTHE
jgi:hypothetical protein